MNSIYNLYASVFCALVAFNIVWGSIVEAGRRVYDTFSFVWGS